ncbi:hypothetical protein QE152_g599 [Popillia japonica]|uniref:Transmembrane protein n=1 Tax=Popillia japonica TaxID=7064 RepID=A0AAW1NAQ1_POPJA
MLVFNAFRTRGNTKKNICVLLCIVFIISCLFLIVCGFVNTQIWGVLYSMPNAPSVAVTIVYVFATLQFITCIFLLIGVKQGNNREILACVLILLALWQVHLIVTFIALILHTVEDNDFKPFAAFTASMPLLCVQALWLYFIAVTWLHWREKSNYTDVPQFIETLILKRKRRKAIQEDQRERLGNLPAKFLQALIPQTRGIASANAL